MSKVVFEISTVMILFLIAFIIFIIFLCSLFRTYFSDVGFYFRYGFGDYRKPCPESVALVEDIVRQQMSTLVPISGIHSVLTILKSILSQD